MNFNGRRRTEKLISMQIGDESFSGSARMPITTAARSSRIMARMPQAHRIGEGGMAAATVNGGLLAGILHAVSGPDHLAALLPRVVGKTGMSTMWFVCMCTDIAKHFTSLMTK